MSSKFVDIASISQVIGTVYNNPHLLEQSDKYKINEEDFPEKFHKIVFGAIYKLFELGAGKITVKNICDFLADKPKSNAIFEKEKGAEWLIQASENATANAFDYYYGRMKKMSLLRACDNYGIDVSWLYDPDNIFDTKKKQQQEEWLDNSPLEAILAKVNGRIEDLKSKYVDETEGEGCQAGEGLDDLLEELKKTPDVGIPMYGNLINTVTRGARLKKFYLRSGGTGLGKAIPNNTLIPTPQGWRKVGDIRPGDYLFGQDGKPTKVLQIHPQTEEKNIWEVHFIDGRIAQCCKDHLWEYWYESHGSWRPRVESTEEIFNRTKSLKGGFKNYNGQGYRFKIKLNEPVEYSKKEYFIHPYVMGALLGDGSFRYDKSNKSLTFSSETDELPNYVCELLKGDYIIHKNSNYNYNYSFKPIENMSHNLWVEELLKDYPELWNCKSEDKFIPKDYLLGSIEQRYELFQGLMDTDGGIDVKGRLSFTTVSKQLRDDMIELCHSLGMVTSYLIDKRKEKYTTGECYEVHIQCKKEIKPKLFRLKRKLQRAIDYANSNKRCEYKEYISISEIIPTEEKIDMTCFTVDNDNHLFLMNDFIVTHNTRTMIADVCNFACDEIYDESFGFIKNGTAEPTLYISTELEVSECQTMMLAFLSNVNEEHILNGKYEGREEERVLHAKEILQRSPLYIEILEDFSLTDVENTLKKYIREKNVSYFVFDYIHTSMKILEEITHRSAGVKLREDNILFMLSAHLKDIANKYGVFILSGTQLISNFQENETPDQNLLRGARAIADKIDFGSILLPFQKKDSEALAPIISSGLETPNLKMSIYKNRRGRYKGIYLWCKADLGTCRVNPIFATDWNYELIKMDDLKIEVDSGAFGNVN